MRSRKADMLPRVKAAVFLSATLKWLVAEVLDLAGNCSKYMKKRSIIPHHIQLTFLYDSELAELTKGGVKAHIHNFTRSCCLPISKTRTKTALQMATSAASTELSSS